MKDFLTTDGQNQDISTHFTRQEAKTHCKSNTKGDTDKVCLVYKKFLVYKGGKKVK